MSSTQAPPAPTTPPPSPARGEGPVGCRQCHGTGGPFDPASGLCEDCLPGGAA